jgi:Fic family protein
MAPHTEEYLQDLRARYLGVNQTLFLRGAQPEFEDLTWDLGKISPLLSEVRSNLDQLLEESNHCDISTTGDVSTWERILSEGINHEHGGNSEGVAETMSDAMRCLNRPLTKQTLCDWHYRMFFFDETRFCVFPIGEYRGLEEGPIFFQDTGFVCCESEKLEEEMAKFLGWFNGESKRIDPLLRVAIAPLWFLGIHPFGNGNGRISRAISEMALAEVDPHIQQSCSIAKQLMIEECDYFVALGKAQTGTSDITEYLAWFLGCINRAFRSKNARPKSWKVSASNRMERSASSAWWAHLDSNQEPTDYESAALTD